MACLRRKKGRKKIIECNQSGKSTFRPFRKSPKSFSSELMVWVGHQTKMKVSFFLEKEGAWKNIYIIYSWIQKYGSLDCKLKDLKEKRTEANRQTPKIHSDMYEWDDSVLSKFSSLSSFNDYTLLYSLHNIINTHVLKPIVLQALLYIFKS